MEVQFRLKGAAKARQYFAHGRVPTLHLYPSGGVARTATVVPLRLEHFTEWATARVGGTPRALCFDLYVDVRNDSSRWCKMHAASATLEFSQLRRGGAAAPLTNMNSRLAFGEIECRVDVDAAALIGAPVTALPTSDATALATQEMGLFRGMTPCDEFLRRVNAPFFRGRCGVMPGPAFFAAAHDTVSPTDNWWRAQLRAVARRRGVQLADWALAVDGRRGGEAEWHRACQLVFEAVSSAVTAYPYCGDFFVDGEVKAQFESFDNYFVREAGDCEDASRAVLQLVTHLQANPASQRTEVGRMATVAKLYAPCAVLGMVSAVAWGQTTTASPQAHMFTKMIPMAQFSKKAGVEYAAAAWEADLKTWCIEATAPVEPFTDVESSKAMFPSDASRYERTRAAQKLPLRSMQRVYRPSLVQQVECSFYKKDVHLYTPSLIQNPSAPNVAAFSLTPSGNAKTWGIDFESVMTGDYALMPHLDYSPQEVAAWGKHFELEHPVVRLVSSSTPRPLPLGFTPACARGARGAKYSDYVVGDVDDLAPADWEYARAWFDAQGAHEACWEGWDNPASKQLRVRVYKGL